MFAIALVTLALQDPAMLVQRALTVADLRASGKVLYRKIDAALKPVGNIRDYGNPFTRVEGDSSALLVTWFKRGLGNPPPPILIYSSGGSVRAKVLHDPNSQGWAPGCFRRIGETIVGAGYVYEGNWGSPLAVALKWRKGAWEVAQMQGSERRSWESRFANRTGSDLVITFRNYEFKSVVTPMAGPALHYESVWKFRNGKFILGKPRLVNNAMAAFDDLVLAADEEDAHGIRRFIPNSAMRSRYLKEFSELEPPYRATCPYGYIYDDGNTFGVEDDSGGAIYCRFTKTRSGWQVVKVGSESEFPDPR